MRLMHRVCGLQQPSLAVSVYPAGLQSEEQREGARGDDDAAPVGQVRQQRPAVKRRRVHTLRSKAANAANLLSAPAATRRSRRSEQSADDESRPAKAHSDDSAARPPASHTAHSSHWSSSSQSALPYTAAFGASSVTARPYFGIQQVLTFVYSYLPRPTAAQTAAARDTPLRPMQPTTASHSHSNDHLHSSHTAEATGSNSPSTAASATAPFPALSSSPVLFAPASSHPVSSPPCPPLHPVSVYDVSSRSLFNDYVVVLLVSSSRQMSFLSSSLYKLARASNAAPLNRGILSVSGRTRDDWQSVDLGSVVVHVFNTRARLIKPGLDYHPDSSMDESLAVPADGLWAAKAEREQRAAEDELLSRHAVIDNIERQFGDLLVPLDRLDALRDYASGEAGQGESRGEEATMLVNDTPLDEAAATAARRTTHAANGAAAAVK